MQNFTLHLENEASLWENATPVGCGKMGAMLFGGVADECLQLNEEKLWAEGAKKVDPEGFCERFTAVREKLLAGEPADDFAKEILAPYFTRIGSYETAGKLHLHFSHVAGAVTEYRRDLDLFNGVATIAYRVADVSYRRTLFASYPKQVIVFRLEADRPAALTFAAHYEREAASVQVSGDTMTVRGSTACGKHFFTAKLRFSSEGGQIIADGDTLRIENADAVEIRIKMATDSEAEDPNSLSYDALLAEHTQDFSSLMSRAAILYERDEALDALPIPSRLARVREGGVDTGLVNLYFEFGRYLLVSSSRIGSLPANLQGVWNDKVAAVWNSDYHTNINLQMNYWHAETANLAECAHPLFDYINNDLLPGGKRVAQDFYRCRGTVLHHLSDIYGFASPADGLWGLWQVGGAWLSYAMWEHHLFSPDLCFLKDVAYPYIAECTRFFLDFMFEDKDGYLATGPSTSPENRYYMEKNGERVKAFLCLSPTMDIAIVRGLLEIYIKSEELLSINADMLKEAKIAYSRLPDYQIGSHGQLLEWQEEYEEAEPGHRHISHAFPLYPGWEIHSGTPALSDAIRTTIHARLSHGGGHTGWSCAWLINLFARLEDGQGAADMIHKLLANSTLDNLFDTHPPFQIDGNFGASAAMVEMLLQSHTDKIVLLPALPQATQYQSGRFYGLRARGDITVDAAWQDGRVTSCTLRAEKDCRVTLSANGKTYSLSLTAKEAYAVTL